MEQKYFETLVTSLCATSSLPEALEILKICDNESIQSEANALTGQFSIAQSEGKSRIYHVFTEENEEGIEEEFVEHVMFLDDEVLVFIAWFFYTQFDIKHRETYAAAGRTYTPPKRNQ